MKNPTILQIALDKPLYQLFDYSLPENLSHTPIEIGMRVEAPWRSKKTIGIVAAIKAKSDLPLAQLKPIISILDDAPTLTESIFKLCSFAAQYYQHPMGEVLFHALPAYLRHHQKNRKKITIEEMPQAKEKMHAPNNAQKIAIEQIIENLNQFQPFLLQGVTGSGKTEVYLHTTKAVLAQNKQVLILVPEIGLTPQMLSRFRARLDCPIVALHSGLNDLERFHAWQKAKSGEAKIVVGTRSAIFTPLPNLGLIVVDEEHDLSFKQQEGFRYSARDLALVRGQFEHCPVVLGSATPSLESFLNAEQKRYTTLFLPERAGNATHPDAFIIDVRGEFLKEGLSQKLIEKIASHLAQKNQVLLFLNRRGFSPRLHCHTCGHVVMCDRCNIAMTFHQQKNLLKCHHCEKQILVPTLCPTCKQSKLSPIGFGTERIEHALKKHFPKTPIIRIDHDTTRKKDSLQQLLKEVTTGQSQILIGTQMLAKGHDFPNVTLVGLLNLDDGLFSTDFRAVERLSQLFTQVAGRAGRADKKGEVYLQTQYPTHPLLSTLMQKSYDSLLNHLLKERKEAGLPPYTHLVLLRAESLNQVWPEKFLLDIKNELHAQKFKHVEILGPFPAPMPKRQGKYRAQLLLQSLSRKHLQEILHFLQFKKATLKNKQKTRFSIDVDPLETG